MTCFLLFKMSDILQSTICTLPLPNNQKALEREEDQIPRVLFFEPHLSSTLPFQNNPFFSSQVSEAPSHLTGLDDVRST